MTEIQNSKQNYYDLEERTLKFVKDCRALVKNLPKTIGYIEDGKQLVRSSGSIHSNHIEANESLSKKDFYHRVKICRKEAKESKSWLILIDPQNDEELKKEQERLIKEAVELMHIFGSIMSKKK